MTETTARKATTKKSWWARHKFLLARRIVQASVMGLFIVGYRADWQVMGREVLEGNLSASRLLGVPLADPLATLQIWLTGHQPLLDTLLGAGIVLGSYWLVGGRVFCSWVCPINPVADGAAWLRQRLSILGGLNLTRRLKYGVLGLALLLSMLTGVAAFEWISPIGMFQRELIYGMGYGWMAAAVIFLFDLILLRQGWCGHLCPLGAFYSLVGRISPVRVGFQPAACTRCGDCHRVCPEPQVLQLNKIGAAERVYSGSCTNCGRCIESCSENALGFTWAGAKSLRPIPQPEGQAKKQDEAATFKQKAS